MTARVWYVSVPDSPSLNVGTGDFSIDAWIKTSSTKDIGAIQDKRIMPRPPVIGYAFFVGNGGIGPGVQFGDGSHYVTVIATSYLADGQFHHVAVTVRRQAADGIKLFLDGNVVLTADPRSVTGSLDNNASFLIGGHSFDSFRTFAGLIDEFEFFKRALTDDEVKMIYLAGSAGQLAGAPGTWTATGSMNTARFVFTATLLDNGKVLAAGGADTTFSSATASTELYDSATGKWTPTEI